MGNYDLAVCASQDMVGRVMAAMYPRPGFASVVAGSEQGQVEGVNVDVRWRMSQPPLVTFEPPTEAEWKVAIKADGPKADPVPGAFSVDLKALALTRIKEDGGSQDTITDLRIICAVQLDGYQASLRPIAAAVDLSALSPIDRAMFKVMIPKLLRQVGQFLEAEHIPQIVIAGATFEAPDVTIGAGWAIGSARMTGSPGGLPPISPASLSGGNFAVLLSPDAIQTIARAAAASVIGTNQSSNGSWQESPLKASYDAAARINGLDITVDRGDPRRVRIAVDAGLSASASVDDTLGILGGIGTAADATVGGVATVIGGTMDIFGVHGADDAIKSGVGTAVDTVSGGIGTAATTVVSGATDAANAVASGVEDAANSVAEAFSSY